MALFDLVFEVRASRSDRFTLNSSLVMFPSPEAAPLMARLRGYRITNRKAGAPEQTGKR
ncbi:MAG: hypothetical protein Q8K23_19190 [Sulfuritalea sp.]|nr:hypothetical protein [Sulfuritalea sp.]